ncbi:MAG: hypothetical protein ABSB40_01955 [Nitrososphaeria archaeon]|jgi:hypothetical protein
MSSKTVYGVIGTLVIAVVVLTSLVGYLYGQKSQTVTETNSQTVTQSITQTSTSTLTQISTVTFTQTSTSTLTKTSTSTLTKTSTSTLTQTLTSTPTISPLNTTSLITYSTTTTYGNNIVTAFTVYLFNGSTSVDAGYFDYAPFKVPYNVMNVTVTGNLTASGELGNDIEVYIMSTSQFDSWYNGNQISAYYNSGVVISANISVSIPAGQSYYMIFDNSFSLTAGKTVSGQITLTYSL